MAAKLHGKDQPCFIPNLQNYICKLGSIKTEQAIKVMAAFTFPGGSDSETVKTAITFL